MENKAAAAHQDAKTPRPVAPGGFLTTMHYIVDAYTRTANAALKPLGITISMAGALSAIDELPDGRASMKQLERLRHTSQSVTLGLVNRLEKRGLVLTYVDPNDARVKIAVITDDGRRILREARLVMVPCVKRMLSGLASGERLELEHLLDKVWDSMNQ